jgi:hypothetical protein
MNQDYVTQLRLQLREAAQREERRAPVAQRVIRARRGLPGRAPLAAALAIALLALAAAIGVLQLRDGSEPVKPKVIQSFHVGDNLGSLSFGFGAAWLGDPVRGQVLRVDPKTRNVTARVDPFPQAARLGSPVAGEVVAVAGAGAVWALAGDLLTSGSEGAVQLVRIDPQRAIVTARIPVRSPRGGNFSPLFVHAGDDYVWVVGRQGALRINPRRNAADRFVAYREDVQAVADGNRVFTLTTEGNLRELDAATGRVVNDVPVTTRAHERLILGPPGFLALGGATTLTLLDRSGKVRWTADVAAEVRAVGFDGDSVWAHVSREPEGPDRLVRLDAETGRSTGSLGLKATEGVALARVGDELWVADPGGDVTVVR